MKIIPEMAGEVEVEGEGLGVLGAGVALIAPAVPLVEEGGGADVKADGEEFLPRVSG